MESSRVLTVTKDRRQSKVAPNHGGRKVVKMSVLSLKMPDFFFLAHLQLRGAGTFKKLDGDYVTTGNALGI